MNTKEALRLVGVPRTVGRVFDLMEIAEREIAEAKRRHAKAYRAGALDGCFLALSPPAELVGRADAVYAHHARELLGRMADPRRYGNLPLTAGTEAQALCVLLDCSLQAPLEQTAQHLAELLFIAVFGEGPSGERRPVVRERWAGAAKEMLTEIRRKTADPSRRRGRSS